jgi:hypothetical protein
MTTERCSNLAGPATAGSIINSCQTKTGQPIAFICELWVRVRERKKLTALLDFTVFQVNGGCWRPYGQPMYFYQSIILVYLAEITLDCVKVY